MSSPRWLLGSVLLCIAYPAFVSAQSEADVNASLKKFTQVYEAVETNFADRPDADNTVFKGAIPNMLHSLDPHSNFFDPKAYQLMREGQSGHYFGVGMYVGSPEGKVIVMYPFVNSPAYRAGLRPADQIIAVDDTNTEHSTVSQVSGMLKGPERNPGDHHRAACRPRRADALLSGARQRAPRQRELCFLAASWNRLHARGSVQRNHQP